jgi:hypothetical protein
MTRRELPVVYIKKFVTGQEIYYSGGMRRIEYVYISRNKLAIKLEGIIDLVQEHKIDCGLSEIDFNLPHNLGLR